MRTTQNNERQALRFWPLNRGSRHCLCRCPRALRAPKLSLNALPAGVRGCGTPKLPRPVCGLDPPHFEASCCGLDPRAVIPALEGWISSPRSPSRCPQSRPFPGPRACFRSLHPAPPHTHWNRSRGMVWVKAEPPDPRRKRGLVPRWSSANRSLEGPQELPH